MHCSIAELYRIPKAHKMSSPTSTQQYTVQLHTHSTEIGSSRALWATLNNVKRHQRTKTFMLAMNVGK